MFGLLCFVLAVLASPFKSKSRLEAENAVLRHQLIVLRRKVPGQVRLTNNERGFLIRLYIDGSRRFCRSPRSSNLRRLFGGTGPAFVATGVGICVSGEGGRKCSG